MTVRRNPVVTGFIGILMVVLLAVAAFSFKDLPFFGAGPVYHAEFSEAAGLKEGNEVRVAGVKVGEVSDVARRVLTTLAEEVPAGTTVTYGQLADRSGTGIPARADGGIMGLNPIPIIVPCHRVVAGDGLGGYSGGLPGHELETKRRLLESEEALPQPLF